jgi:hypothetical protein
LLGDGAAASFWLQCHHALIGAPSPIHANQPWYPTVILPTTSPAAEAALAGDVNAETSSVPPTAARVVPASAEPSNFRREIGMATSRGYSGSSLMAVKLASPTRTTLVKTSPKQRIHAIIKARRLAIQSSGTCANLLRFIGVCAEVVGSA